MRNSRGSSRRGRIAAWIVVATVAVTAFASLGGVGLAQNAIGLHQYQYGKKVTVCHKGKQSIRISLRGWLAHKRHGDAVGTCEAWKKHGKHWKLKKHGKLAKHGKQWKKDRGSRSDDAKTLKSGSDVSPADTSGSGSDESSAREVERGERGGKGERRDGGKREGRSHDKGGKKR